MLTRIFVIFALLKLYCQYCVEAKRFEANEIKISPMNEAIIFSDIVDILKDLNGNLNMHFQPVDDSESDESAEDLLSEYQHYLDKMHEKRLMYSINNPKNKVPLLPKEGMNRKKLPAYTNDGYHAPTYFNPNIMTLPSTAINGPFDLFIPLNFGIIDKQESERENIPESNIVYEKQPTIKGQGKNRNEMLNSTSFPFTDVNNKTLNVSCPCKSERWPCSCNSLMFNDNDNVSLKYSNGYQKQNSDMPVENVILHRNSTKEITNKVNNFNVRIKVDIQLPSFPNSQSKYGKSTEEFNSNEYLTNINLPSTYFTIPFPLDDFGYKKIIKKNRQVFNPLHKIMIRNKNKLRSSSNNKKHRRKFIPFNKLEPSKNPQQIDTREKQNKSIQEFAPFNLGANATHASRKINLPNFAVNSTDDDVNKSQVDENIVFMVNISNNINDTDKRLGNSIEDDNKLFMATTITPLLNTRAKRESTFNNVTADVKFVDLYNNEIKKYSKWKSNKMILSDNDLLYWPSRSTDETLIKMRNINDLLLKREKKKFVLNISSEMINRTMALQQAIFGNVDWNDIDTIVPIFVEFIGKYINGAITFCSDRVCHSMKCANSLCVHRICAPEQLFNQSGHCTGSNKTDSFLLMEPIIDLPSEVAFTAIDILEEKMLGKLFGKITLCIKIKCISFATAKRTFIKFKCESKNLNRTGHCPNTISNKTA